MWTRSVFLLLAAGCISTGDIEDPVATVTQGTAVEFQCLNTGDLHVVECQGSISLFPIIVTIEHLHVLSGNDLTVLSGDLDDLAVLDHDVDDPEAVLDDVETIVLQDFLDKFHITVTRSDVRACTTVLGGLLCK